MAQRCTNTQSDKSESGFGALKLFCTIHSASSQLILNNPLLMHLEKAHEITRILAAATVPELLLRGLSYNPGGSKSGSW